MKKEEKVRKEKEIWVVSGNFYDARLVMESLAELYPDTSIIPFSRDYHFEGAMSSGEKPDAIVFDCSCTSRQEGDYHSTFRIPSPWYPEPFFYAFKKNIKRESFYPIGTFFHAGAVDLERPSEKLLKRIKFFKLKIRIAARLGCMPSIPAKSVVQPTS